MVIDSFLFNNELDLLEIRLNILNDVVDKFILVEADTTFSGQPKPLYYQENKERYSKWNHKIEHIIVNDDRDDLMNMAINSPNVGAGEHWWVREFYQKEFTVPKQASDSDIVFISDLDEIWNPKIAIYQDLDKVYRPKMDAYHYYLNNRSNQDINGWTGTRFSSYKTLKKYGANHFRTEREVESILVLNGGWHFSNMGNMDFIKEKLEAYGHQEFNNEQIKSKIEEHIKNNTDFLGRGFSLWKDESDLPEYILNNKEKWSKYLL